MRNNTARKRMPALPKPDSGPEWGLKDGPGPNCPIKYSVDPDPATYQSVVGALTAVLQQARKETVTGGLLKRGIAAATVGNVVNLGLVRRFKNWINTWHTENDRLSWNYLTLRLGKAANNSGYAEKFQAFHRDTSQLRFIRAPNQVGKTYAAAAEVYFYATGRHPWKKLRRKWNDPTIKKTILIVTGSDKNREGVFQALWNLCPINEVDWVNTHFDDRNMWGQRNPSIHFPKTNTRVIFRASNQDTDSLNSMTVDLVWIDEPPKQGTIDEIRRGSLARSAPMIMTFTPVGEENEDFTWLRHYVEGDEELGIEPKGDWSQHWIGIPDCPWFTQAQIEERRRAYSDAQMPQRFYGAWEGETSNKSFSHFKEGGKENVILDLFEIRGMANASQWKFAVGNDHGEKGTTQTAVLLAYNVYTKEVVLLHEYVSRASTTPAEDARHIRRMLADVGLVPAMVSLWVGDINTGGKVVKGEKLNRLLGRELGVVIFPPRKYQGSVETGERRINSAFEQKVFKVHIRCKNSILSFRHYQGTDTAKDKKYKHLLDACRYSIDFVLDRLGVCMVQSGRYTGHKKKVKRSMG